MDLAAALDFARTNHHGVLTTIRTNGRPQLSNVAYHAGDDGTIGISITATRAKYTNLLRVPWAALHVTRPDFYAYAVIEADVDVSPVAAQPDDDTVDQLVAYYRAVAGEHEDWNEYREAMVADQRVYVRLRPDRAYGMLPSQMVVVDTARFEEMVSEALDGLPPKLGRVMRNVAVTVDNDGGPPGLLGLYQGVPLTERTTYYSAVLPDQITIYRHAICAICTTEAEVVEQVRRTVIHEVGHHFGIDDDRLHELGW